MTDRRALLSTLWIFAMLNYLYCDVVSLMDSGLLPQYLSGTVNGMSITSTFLLAASVLMEIPIAMVLLTRVLGQRANRWANLIAGTMMTVVQAGPVDGCGHHVLSVLQRDRDRVHGRDRRARVAVGCPGPG